MKINNSEEKYFHTLNHPSLSREQLLQSLGKWLKESKRLKKEHHWTSLFITLTQLIMPDIDMNQLLILQDSLIEKLYHFVAACDFRSETLFTGIEVKLTSAFIAIDTTSKLQKVITQGTQIKQVSPITTATLIKRSQLSPLDKKQKLLIYNRHPSQSTFAIIDLKTIQKTRNQIFKQDHNSKMKFFCGFVFGQVAPSFCAAGVKVVHVGENQVVQEGVQLNGESVYLVYTGAFTCFLENSKGNCNVKSNNTKRQASSQFKSQRVTHSPTPTNRIQLHKGSIIQTSSFHQIMQKINKQTQFKFQTSKAITDSILIEIKSTEFLKAILFDNRCQKYYLTQYQKILESRRLLFTEARDRVNNFFEKCQNGDGSGFVITVQQGKQYTGFRRYKTQRNSIEGFEKVATVGIYDTMIKNKEKIVTLQNDYKNKKKSQKKPIMSYQDNKNIKQNYKRLKIKNFQIQKIALRSSITNIKDCEGVKLIKSRLNEVKGMFQDEIDEVEKIIKEQRRAMLEVEISKKNQKIKRKGMRIQTYSPEQGSYYNKSLNYTKTFGKSQRASLAQSIVSNTSKEESEQNTLQKIQTDEQIFESVISLNKDSFNSGSDMTEQFFSHNQETPLKCINNFMYNSEEQRTGRRTITNMKHQCRRPSKFNYYNSKPSSIKKIVNI